MIEDPAEREEKITRERIRHPQLVRDLLLDRLPTASWNVIEIGGGPVPVTDLIPFRQRAVIDPLTEAYSEFFPTPHHAAMQAEDIAGEATVDLVVCTNALDHVEDVEMVLRNIQRALRPGGYFAVMCAENNAVTNPHPAHAINLTAADLHRSCGPWAEAVWELTYPRDGYRYGWAEYEGRRGQPAFAILFRKCTGYERET
jgi:SAM-dependent methyltransferase